MVAGEPPRALKKKQARPPLCGSCRGDLRVRRLRGTVELRCRLCRRSFEIAVGFQQLT